MSQQGNVQSLAGPFVIQCSADDDASSYSWSLQTIASNGGDHPYRAWQALHNFPSPKIIDNHEDKGISIHVTVESDSNRLQVAWTGRDNNDKKQHDNDDDAGTNKQQELFSILQAVAVQWVATRVTKMTTAANTLSPQAKWQVVAESSDNLVLASFGLDENPVELFTEALERLGSSPEWVEMVDQTGQPLGRVPRPLVHTHNLLHRGIGMFVTKDRSIFASATTTANDAKSRQDLPDLYVHQRTATKRIFPSLYDMFVGGVAGAGESSRVTAQREVAEELGLQQASHLSTQALLTCVVCTGYNRCVVDLYEYVMDTSQEQVAWQAEEVAWGSFCSYNLVEAAADRSLQRLESQKAWPGKTPVIQSPRKGELVEDCAEDAWKEWDFVPDGLLVWEAWLEWRAKKGEH